MGIGGSDVLEAQREATLRISVAERNQYPHEILDKTQARTSSRSSDN